MMTPDPDDGEALRGLARSIDRLFSDAEEHAAVAEREESDAEVGDDVEAVADGRVEPQPVEHEHGQNADDETVADDAAVDAFWEMDEIESPTDPEPTAPDPSEADGSRLDGIEFDAGELDGPELDDDEVAAAGLGGDEFDAADLDRIDYDADFDSDFDDEGWAELLADTPGDDADVEASESFPEPGEAPDEDPEWDEMGGWGLDLVGGSEPEEVETAEGDARVAEPGGDRPPETPEEGEETKPRREAPGPEPTAEESPSPVGEPAPATEAGPATLFARAVDTYLAGSDNPTRARTRIQHYAEALGEDGDFDDVADGIERLAAAGGDAVEIAREILSPPVAYVLAGRLSRFTGEDERKERVELAVRLGYDFAPALSAVLAETENKVARYALVDALVAMGVDGWDAVVEMVGDERWWVVRNAVLVLGRTGGEESVRFLTRTIEHDDPRVRLETVEALEEIGGVKARDRIQSRLDDEAPRVRAAAVRAVGTLDIEGARERLRTMLERESDETVEVAVIETLGRMGDAPSIARFEKKLEGSFFRKPTTEIRAAVYGAFGAIGTPRALELLRAASEEKDPVTRTLARRVLRDLEGGEGDEDVR